MKDDNSCHLPCDKALLNQNSKWLKISFFLVGFTILYNVGEALVAVWAGQQTESIALLGFGFDSLIEVSAAAMMFWRLIEQVRNHQEDAVEKAEANVHRFVGVTFLLLAVYIVMDSSLTLWHQERPHPSLLGVALAVLSLIIMPLLSWGKMKAAKEIKSPALRAEAKETIACSVLSLILLIGLAANVYLGWWWADPVAAIAMLPWLLKEGVAGIKGEDCCG